MKNNWSLPLYVLVEESGEPHCMTFIIECKVSKLVVVVVFFYYTTNSLPYFALPNNNTLQNLITVHYIRTPQ